MARSIDMESPLVSIIMPAFNAEKTISESINSVLAQSYKNWELIIIDDGSSDATTAISKRFQQKDKRLILRKLEPNRGLSSARNEGCKAAKGAFITFLDSDDLWEKEKLQIQVNYHMKNLEIEISHTDFDFFDSKGRHKRWFKPLMERKKDKQGLIYPNICYRNSIGILTVMVKRELIMKVNYFDPSLWTLEDQDLWIRIAKTGKLFGYIPNVLAYYRVSPGGITKKTSKYKKAYKTFLKKISKSEGLKPDRLFRNYYRHFGTVYLKNRNYHLSQLYFYKSIQLIPFDFISISTMIYMIYGLVVRVLPGGPTQNNSINTKYD